MMAVALGLAVLAMYVSSASASAFGVSKWEAGTCTESGCTDGTPGPFYTQAAGHPNFGITDFRFQSQESAGLAGTVYTPVGHVKDVRVDLPSGLSVNPEATPTCSEAQIEAKESLCPVASQVGEDEATGTVNATEALLNLLKLPKLPLGLLSTPLTVTEKFPVYNMERKPGEAARFGVEVNSLTVALLGLKSVIFLEGGLSWYHETEAAGGESSGVNTGDYHEYFKIENIPTTPELVESKLIFWGRPHEHDAAAPERSFITMPSNCSGPQVTLLHVDSYEMESFQYYKNTTPVGASGCSALEFKPTIAQRPETTQSDAPDGDEVTVQVPQATDQPTKPNSPDLLETGVTLPEGMTLDPSAATGLAACEDKLFKLGSNQKIECPAQSVVGSVSVDAPGIPDGSLTGSVYLGTPKSTNPASGQEYRILVGAQAPTYGIGMRLEGKVSADPVTGRLTANFSGLPPVPFESFTLKFKGGAGAPLANPLACGMAATSAAMFPYSGELPATPTALFDVDFNGKRGACPSPLPFEVHQSTQSSSTTAGSHTSFTLELTREQGRQYISQLSTSLPTGMIGDISAVARCGEAEARAGNCPSDAQIGEASVTIGSGPNPLVLPPGPVYLTGPYEGAPFGLAIVTNAEKVGPFDYGLITTRAKIEIDPYTARVTVASPLPTVIGGAPVRLRSISVDINQPAFMLNPTSCARLSTDTSLISTFGSSDAVASPFQASKCGALGFKPSLSAITGSRTSRKGGAALRVSLEEHAGQANIHSVAVTLPRKLVARLSTLKGACLEKTFDSDPYSCSSAARVGSVSVTTPLLPDALTGSAFFVSHGGAAFPDLDLVLQGDGVRIILVGNTKISGAYTHSTFATLPDVPVKRFELKLSTGPHSALAANGNLCRGALYMPTRMTAQNGKSLTQRTKIGVEGCKGAKKKRRKRSRRHRHKHKW